MAPTEPQVSRWGGQPTEIGGPENPSTPLVVLLHGRGSTEDSMVRLAPYLPFGPAYAAVRGPIDLDGGYGWYDAPVGTQPSAAALAETMDWFMAWLDAEGDPERPVVLVGFSAGALVAAGLLLSRPERWAGAVLLHGPLPFDAGVPVTPGRLIGIPLFLAHGEDDTVVPPELQSRTWDYLTRDSGAPVRAERAPGGHELSGDTLETLATWLGERLTFLGAQGENPLPDGEDQEWPTLPGGTLPPCPGPPDPDGKPVVLPVALAYDAVAKGWAVADPRAGLTLPTGAVLIAERPDPADAVTAYALIATAHIAT